MPEGYDIDCLKRVSGEDGLARPLLVTTLGPTDALLGLLKRAIAREMLKSLTGPARSTIAATYAPTFKPEASPWTELQPISASAHRHFRLERVVATNPYSSMAAYVLEAVREYKSEKIFARDEQPVQGALNVKT
jgi:hypothetical protein